MGNGISSEAEETLSSEEEIPPLTPWTAERGISEGLAPVKVSKQTHTTIDKQDGPKTQRSSATSNQIPQVKKSRSAKGRTRAQRADSSDSYRPAKRRRIAEPLRSKNEAGQKKYPSRTKKTTERDSDLPKDASADQHEGQKYTVRNEVTDQIHYLRKDLPVTEEKENRQENRSRVQLEPSPSRNPRENRRVNAPCQAPEDDDVTESMGQENADAWTSFEKQFASDAKLLRRLMEQAAPVVERMEATKNTGLACLGLESDYLPEILDSVYSDNRASRLCLQRIINSMVRSRATTLARRQKGKREEKRAG